MERVKGSSRESFKETETEKHVSLPSDLWPWMRTTNGLEGVKSSPSWQMLVTSFRGNLATPMSELRNTWLLFKVWSW